ncbi:MAG: peptide-methionine (S)-S-oxide reductase [Legionellales bacterium]|nr:peptide-methionine (S)-S-oxide reductase [Legionellales bacterium]|tara:strand:+ start:5082 stop:5540 length:459 start_codon:yes stop_codon:yes gene_type:complete
MTTATFAAGCFWGVEALFQKTPGVTRTQVGYTGGHSPNPSYEQVCSGQTGHAEAVQLEFDPDIISYDELVQIFFANHDPTTLNAQGPDHGNQYRSAIFTHDKMQMDAATKAKNDLSTSGRFENPIVTEITEACEFYPAEEYHQCYLEKQGRD